MPNAAPWLLLCRPCTPTMEQPSCATRCVGAALLAVSVHSCFNGFVFQRLYAAAACVPLASRVVCAPLCRATVPERPRACLRGHFRSRKSGRRAGAESGGCMRGAGGGPGRRRLCDSQKPPSPPPQRVRRGTRGGSGRRRRGGGGAAAGGGGDVTKVARGVKWCGFVFQRLFEAAACVPPCAAAPLPRARRAPTPLLLLCLFVGPRCRSGRWPWSVGMPKHRHTKT